MANKKLFEATTGTPTNTHRFAYGKAGEASKTIELPALKTLIAGATKTTVIEIGPWSMFSILGSPDDKTVANPIVMTKIRGISVMIVNDANDKVGIFPSGDNSKATPIYLSGTNILLSLSAGSYYDSTSYNSSASNRGWITITHVE